jgi:hypothetical protein
MVAHIVTHRVSLTLLDKDAVLDLFEPLVIVVDQRLEQGRHFSDAFDDEAHVLLQGLEWRFAKQSHNRLACSNIVRPPLTQWKISCRAGRGRSCQGSSCSRPQALVTPAADQASPAETVKKLTQPCNCHCRASGNPVRTP